jgi:hypothetical protein
MTDFRAERMHDEFERGCARVARDREMFVYSPLRSEHQWWTGYLGYMATLPGFNARAWFSTVEEWLNRLVAIGSPLDEAHEELERLRGET